MSCGILWLWRTFVFRLGGSFLLHQQAWPARFSSCCLQCWWKGSKVFSNTCLNKGEIIYIYTIWYYMYVYLLFIYIIWCWKIIDEIIDDWILKTVCNTDWLIFASFVRCQDSGASSMQKYGPGQRRVKCSGSQACPGRWKWFATTAR